MRKIPIVLITLAVACSAPKKEQPLAKSLQDSEGKIVSFSGKELPPKQISDSVRAKLETNLKVAEEAYAKFPDSVDLAIWNGRRIAYLGEYLEAIEFYSKAIEKFPDDHRLYRHRGHRYISVRQIDKAISDFEKATELAEKVPNQIELDGIPNKLDQPLGNDRFNIYYHHALAYYLKGDFEKAIPIYQKCSAVSDNPDLLVATNYWLFMAMHRTGKTTAAKQLLVPINADIELIENSAYLNLLLLFKGDLSADEILEKATASTGVGSPTLMYGLGNYFLQNGDDMRAEDTWSEILSGPSWDAFGYIAADAEMASTN